MKTKRKLLALSKRALAMMLAALMVVTLVPSSIVFAQTPEGDEAVYEIPAEEALVEDALGDDSASDDADTPEEILKEGEEAKNTVAASDIKAVIKVNETNLQTNVKNAGLAYNYATGKAEAIYQRLDADKLTAFVKNAVSVEQGAAVSDYLKSKVTYAWKKADGTAVAAPDVVGEYKLVASLAAQEGYCAAADDVEVLALEVKKETVELTGVKRDFDNGVITAKDIKDANADITITVNGTSVPKDDYVSALALKVVKVYPDATTEEENGYTAVELKDTDVLHKDKEDYRLEVAVTLKDTANYEMGVCSYKIVLGQETPTWIEVTGEPKGKTYDGAALAGYGTAETPADFSVAGDKGFTAKVYYKDSNGEKKEVPESQKLIKGTWYTEINGNRVKAGDDSFAPVDAGVYYYRLSYTDENDVYADAVEKENGTKPLDLKVEIDAAQIVVVPEIAVSAEDPLYSSTTVEEALKRVTYKVYPVVNGVVSTDALNVDEYFWGAAYSVDYKEQYYAPVFAIERGVKDKATGKVAKWESYSLGNMINVPNRLLDHEDTETIDENGNKKPDTIDYAYRLVFDGEKAIYSTSMLYYLNKVDINYSQKNYTVDVSAVTKENNAKELTVTPATKVEIDVTPILALHSGKGAAFDAAYAKEYDGEKLYANRGEYKIATVKGADDAALVYTWEVADLYASLNPANATEDKLAVDKDGKLIAERIKWVSQGSYNSNVEDYAVPYAPGIYRLRVSLANGTKKYYTEDDAYVYYIIQPQNMQVSLTGTPFVYADGKTTIAGLLNSLQADDETKADSYVSIKVYPVTVDAAGVATPVAEEADENTVSSGIEELIKYYFKNNRANYFYVEEETATGWVRSDADALVTSGVKYRVAFNSEAYNSTSRRYVDSYIVDKKEIEVYLYDNRKDNLNGSDDISDNIKKDSYPDEYGRPYNSVYKFYNFGQKIDAQNCIVTRKFYENVPVVVDAKQSAGTQVIITVDETLLTGNVKTYDGKPFDLAGLKSIIKFTDAKTGTDIATDTIWPLLKISFKHSDGFWSSFNGWNDGKVPSYITQTVDASKAIHADNYIVTIELPADATYMQASTTLTAKYKIEKKEIKVTPEAREVIRAGVAFPNYQKDRDQFVADYILKSGNVLNCCTFEIVGDPVKVEAAEGQEGIDETDVAAIVGKPYNWGVYESTRDTLYSSYLRNSQTYYAKANSFEYGRRIDSNYEGYIDYSNDYIAVCEKLVFKPAKAAASVTTSNVLLKDEIAYDETADKFTHTITARQSVPYDNGNFFRFNLYAPAEFRAAGSGYRITDNAFFANSIKNIEKAGGEARTYTHRDGVEYIRVEFDASKGGKPVFEVLWDNDYAEKYVVDLASMVLDADLRKAVAPKSLSFNGKSSKMAVGETQQLDVNIKKNRMSDIILLGYSSDNENILQVSEDGFVTALSKGSATIEVYPCTMVNGVKTRIETENGKPVKVGKKLKITVKDVSKPKISKVTPTATGAKLVYGIPADGYRREIYVLSGKQTDKAFEAKIAEVTNGDYYSAFTYVNLNSKGCENSARKTGELNLYLAPNGEYTVYVRNVSGLRELENGTQVATSVAGAVKTFKTTKPVVAALTLNFDNTVVYENGRDRAQFSNKKVQVSTSGLFLQSYLEDYSDGKDFVVRLLPLKDKKEKSVFNAQKLNYFVCDSENGGNTDPEGRADGIYSDAVVLGGDKYAKTSAVAKIDKKGKITLTGVTNYNDYIYVIVYDSVSGKYNYRTLSIQANPDALSAAKSVKLQPGQSVMLSELVEYKEKKAKVINYQKYYRDLSTKTESNESFKIDYVTDKHNNKDYQGGDYKIEVLKPGTIEIDVTDGKVAQNGGGSVKIKLTAVAVEPVKSLKVKAAYDDKFRVTFQYPRDNMTFKFELKDAANKTILTSIETCDAYWSAKSKKYIYTVNFADPKDIRDWDDDEGEYIPWKDWKYSYDESVPDWKLWFEDDEYADTIAVNKTINTNLYGRNRINMLSNYTVTVTAYSDDYKQESKPVNLKVKTTAIPASYHDVVAENVTRYWTKDDRNDVAYDGGTDVNISEAASYANNNTAGVDSTKISQPFVFKTGNTYTLAVDLNTARENSVARQRVTDTLTWKVYDSKVATIKANPGSYTAKLTAKKQGSTVVEITSKLTKKVISRYHITVGAAGDGNYYFGDNEPYNGDDGQFLVSIPETEKDVLAITLNNPINVTLKPGEKQWFVFTAPAYGEYFVYDGGYTYYGYLEKGAKRYFSITNITRKTDSFQARVETDTYNSNIYTSKVVVGENAVSNGMKVVFTAPEDNVYTFEYVEKGDAATAMKIKPDYLIRYDNDVKYANPYAMAKGASIEFKVNNSEFGNKEYILKITKREVPEANKLSLTADKEVELKVKDETIWYSFTADESNYYTFTITPDKDSTAKEIKVGYYSSLKDSENTSISNDAIATKAIYSKAIKAGETIYISMKSKDAASDSIVKATIKVTKRELEKEELKLGSNESITFKADGEKWFAFTAPSAGTYQFTASGKTKKGDAAEQDATLNLERFNSLENGTGSNLTTFVATKTGEKIYVHLAEAGVVPEDDRADTNVTAKIVIEKVNMDFTGSITVNVPADSTKTITWNPKQEGRYNIKLTTTAEEDKKPNISAYVDSDVTANQLSTTKSLTGYPVEIGDHSIVISNTNASEVSVTIEIGDYAIDKMAVGAESKVSLANNDEMWLKFTAPEWNFYSFRFQQDDASKDKGYTVSVDVYKANGDLVENNISLNSERRMEDGETIYLKLTPANTMLATETVGGNFTVTKREYSGTLKTGDNTIELTSSAQKWYEFVVTETGRYTISAEGSMIVAPATTATPANLTLQRYNNLTYSDYTAENTNTDGKVTYTSGYSLKAGNRYILSVSSSDASATQKVTAKVTITKDQEFTGGSVKVTIPKKDAESGVNGEKVIYWNPTGYNRYDVSMTTAVENPDEVLNVTVAGTTLKASEPIIGTVYGPYTYKIVLTNSGNTDAEVTINTGLTKATRLTMASEGNSVTTKKNADTWYTFTAPKTATYIFKVALSDRTKGFDVYYYTSLLGTDRYYIDGETMLSMNEGDTYYFRLNTNVTADSKPVDVTGNIKISEFVYTDILAVGDTGKNIDFTNTNTDAQYYAFTAEEDDVYTFTWGAREAGKTFDVNVTLTDKDNRTYTANDTIMYMKKGDRVKIQIKPNGTPAEDTPYNGNFKVLKRSVTGNLSTSNSDGAEVTLSNDGYVWYAFTATEENRYTFTLAPKTGRTSTATINYSAYFNNPDTAAPVEAPDEGGVARANRTVNMNKGDKVYFRLRSSNATAENKAEYTFKVTKRNVAGEIALITEKDVTAEYVSAKQNWYTFETDPVGGNYKVTLTPNTETDNLRIEIYKTITATTYSSYCDTEDGKTKNINLDPDNKYYILVTSSSTSPEKTAVNGKIKIEKVQ